MEQSGDKSDGAELPESPKAQTNTQASRPSTFSCPQFSFYSGPLNSEREHRLIYFSLTGLLAIIVVAISAKSGEGDIEESQNALCAAGMLTNFFLFILFLLLFSPKECVRSCSPLYVCGNLCIAEYLIGGLNLDPGGAFSVRGTSYIMVGTVALVESSSGIEWTLFRLMGSISLEIAAWILLIILHSNDSLDYDVSILAHHTIASALITLPLWYTLYFHIKSQRDKYEKSLSDGDSSLQNSNEHQEVTRVSYNIDSKASLKRSNMDEKAFESPYPKYGTPAYYKREAIKSLLVQQIMSGFMFYLHIFVIILVILSATNSIDAHAENALYHTVINSALGLWQIAKIFLEYGWELSDQNLRFLSKVQRAQKDTIRTLQSLADELKWPLASLRGLRLARESKETIETLKRATRSLIWVGHLMKMLELGNEALVLKRISRRPRKIAVQHLIKTISACLSCQTTATIKDLNTTVSVNSHRLAGKYNPKAVAGEVQETKPEDIHVVANQDILLYGMLGMHSLIVALADPHQELRLDFSVHKSKDGNEATIEARLYHWGQCPAWEPNGSGNNNGNSSSSSSQTSSNDVNGSPPNNNNNNNNNNNTGNEEQSDIQQLVVENLRYVIGGSIESTMRGRMCETIFRVTLPTKSKSEMSPSSTTTTTTHSKKVKKNKCVLLVEDSMLTRKIMKKHIEAVWPNSEIEECANGEEAIVRVAHLGQEKFDIIFLDYYLGTEKEMTGVQLCMKLRQYAVHATIIGVTGDENGIALPDFLLNGADLVFLKPINRSMLSEVFDKDDEENGNNGNGTTAIDNGENKS
eukprot:gene6218-12596_t